VNPAALWVAAPWWALVVGMFADEFYFHYKRGLPRWERIGHPIDTAAVLACFAVALFAPPTSGWVRAYAVLAFVSMALVTKDELVHAALCGPGESWLHSVLFMIHPLALLGAAVAWLAVRGRLTTLGLGLLEARFLHRALLVQAGLGLGFFLYQVVYWNFICAPAPESTTSSTTA
jgi:hypothetical protein